MRTKFLYIAILVGVFSLSSVNAGSGNVASEATGREFKRTDREVGRTLENMFSKAPLEELMDGTENLNIKFRINKNNNMTDIKVTGENKELADYVYQKLMTEKISINSAKPDKYSIDMVFVLRR